MKVRIGYGLGATCGRCRGEALGAARRRARRAPASTRCGSPSASARPSPDPVLGAGVSRPAARAHQARHERAVLPGPQPRAARQGVGDARRAVGRPGPARVRARRSSHRSSSRRSASTRADRASIFDEALPLLRRLLDGGRRRPRRPAGSTTSHERAAEAAAHPLDVWLGGQAPSELRRGRAASADGWLASFATPAECKAARSAIEDAADAAGREIDPEHFGVMAFYTHDAIPDAFAAGDREPATPTSRSTTSSTRLAAAAQARASGTSTVGFSKLVLVPLGTPRTGTTSSPPAPKPSSPSANCRELGPICGPTSRRLGS